MATSEKFQDIRESGPSDRVAGRYDDRSKSLKATRCQSLNAKLANPLAGFSKEELRIKGREYAVEHSLANEEDLKAFEVGAMLAQDPDSYEECQDISASDMDVLKKEFSNRWSQPKLLYLIIVLCSTCAAVQGMGK